MVVKPKPIPGSGVTADEKNVKKKFSTQNIKMKIISGSSYGNDDNVGPRKIR